MNYYTREMELTTVMGTYLYTIDTIDTPCSFPPLIQRSSSVPFNLQPMPKPGARAEEPLWWLVPDKID